MPLASLVPASREVFFRFCEQQQSLFPLVFGEGSDFAYFNNPVSSQSGEGGCIGPLSDPSSSRCSASSFPLSILLNISKTSSMEGLNSLSLYDISSISTTPKLYTSLLLNVVGFDIAVDGVEGMEIS
ncbi:uncharacterized protein G2W53_018932 [Senna tora]|uniref:Uncharacterized protein n=1 Tax=Senna tora TaxID=362788 RepID=A0A834TTC5_9FABA|nr:uncharacterized protein G2W53_018932 [Senna tora]